MKRALALVLIATALVMISACASAPTATPVPPTPVPPTSVPPTPQPTDSGPLTCERVSGPCLEVWFNEEEGCRYTCPSVMPPGTMTIILHNETDSPAMLRIGWMDEGYTYDDWLELLGPTLPTVAHGPTWWHPTNTPLAEAGESKQNVKPVEAGTFFWVCLQPPPAAPWLVWGSGTFTVEE